MEFLDLYDERTNIAIGDASLLSEFSYSTSIDSDTYNQLSSLKRKQGHKEKRDHIEKDSTNINRWGTLQYYEVVQENMNDAQIRTRADMLPEYYNKA